MELLSPTDIFLLKASAISASVYATKYLASNLLRPKPRQPDLPLLTAAKEAKVSSIQPTRSILKQLEQQQRSCIILYGSQTGTAETFAHRFARAALVRFNLGCIVGDLDEYDFGDLSKLSKQHLVVFIVATYGEGEPTDNALGLKKFLNAQAMPTDLNNLCYCAFGLGSSSYTHYNAMVRQVDDRLQSCNAHRVGSVGMGDDGKGTLQDDFDSWATSTLPSLGSHFNLCEVPYIYKPAFEINETTENDGNSRHIFRGEPNKAHLYNRVQGPFTAQNPFPAKITNARELFTTTERSCVHMDFDVSNTSIAYNTGDHIAVQPVNSDLQVELFLEAFGLRPSRGRVIDINPTDLNTKLPVPAKTTYEAIVRYYLDICAVITRQTLLQLSAFATSGVLQDHLRTLANDKALFAATVTARNLTIGQLLSEICKATGTDCPAIKAPFSLILELIPKLRPRHYSISSSSLISRKKISITAVINTKEDTTNGVSFKGVSTSYLSALKQAHESPPNTNPPPTTHTLLTPRQFLTTTTGSPPPPKALIHIRPSKFHPPFNPTTPLILIGPGTGIAPFHAFIQERAHQHSQHNRRIGRTLLFYGCRSPTQDFLYKDYWTSVLDNESLGRGVFSMYTAFSREEGRPKRYVQDLLGEEPVAEEIRELVLRRGGVVYVCGDARGMAKGVAAVLGWVLSPNWRGVDTRDGEGGVDAAAEVVAGLKRAGKWCEDVW